MIRSNVSRTPVADVEISSLPKDQTTKTILNFLGIWFPAFRTDYLAQFVALPENDRKEAKKEDRISENLLLYLQTKAKATELLFHFQGKKGVDFFIYVEPMKLSSKPIFMIEAKRLPSPNNGKQYVVGQPERADGIERFKCEQEGFVLNASHCAMVAYVQHHTFVYWFKRVNRWLAELIADNQNYADFDWEESDKLVEISPSTNDVARYVSNHSRKTLSRLTINHFWLDMRIEDSA